VSLSGLDGDALPQEALEELDLALSELEGAHQDKESLRQANQSLRLEKEEVEVKNALLESERDWRTKAGQGSGGAWSGQEPALQLADGEAEVLLQGMVAVLRDGATRQTPRQILELVDQLSPGSLVLLPTPSTAMKRSVRSTPAPKSPAEAIPAPSNACAPVCSSRRAAGAIAMTPPAPRTWPTAASWWARSAPRSRRAGAEPTAARRSARQRTLQVPAPA